MRVLSVLASMLASFKLADADVVFTRERCDRTKFGLQALRGEPSRYRQCGPNGRVWIVPCVPGAVFDPLHKVCKELPATSVLNFQRNNGEARRRPLEQQTPITEEFIFSTRLPKRPRTKTKDRSMAATSSPLTTSTSWPRATPSHPRPPVVRPTQSTGQFVVAMPRTPAVPTSMRTGTTRPYRPAFPPPNGKLTSSSSAAAPMKPTTSPSSPTVLPQLTPRGYTETGGPIPVSESYITRAYPSAHTAALQGSMHPTLTPEVLQSTDPSGAHAGATMSEDEFMHQLMRLVKAHQVAYNGIQEGNTAWTTGSKSFQGEVMQEKNSYVGDQSDILKHTNEIEKQFELERVRLEKQRREQQIEREFEERQLKEKERIERQRNVVKEIEREAEERRRREREWLEKQRKKALHLQEMQAKAREEFERRQQLAAQLVQQQREERENLEKQQEQARLALEKKRREEEELQKRQQAERQIEEMKEKEKRKKLEEQRERGRQLMEKQRKEKELQKKQNIAREMKEMQRKQKENEERLWEIVRQTEARQQKEKDEHLRLQQLAREFEERKRKEEEALLKTQQEEEDRKEEALLKIQQEEEDRKEQAKNEAERIRQEGERRQSEEMMRIEAANRIRAMGSGNLLPAMSSRGSSGDNGHAHTFHPEATDFPGRVDFQTSQTLPVDPNVIHFTAAPSTVPSAVPAWVRGPQPWRLPPDPNTNQPEWFEPSTTETPTRILSGCVPEGDCNFSYDQDLLCPHPSDSSRYLQCTPMIGRRGRWTERNCPPTLVFLHAHAACGAQNVDVSNVPFQRQKTAMIPRLPSETEIVRWQENRVLPPNRAASMQPAFNTPPPKSIYETIEAFPEDLLPLIDWSGYPAHYETVGFEGDPSMNPLFPRVVPQFSSPFAKMRDGAGEEGNFFGGVIKPVIKKIAMDQAESFLDRILSDESTKDDDAADSQEAKEGRAQAFNKP